MKRPRFIGRQNELAAIMAEFDKGAQGSRVISIVGPTGIGKKTFLSELRKRMARKSAPIVWIRPLGLSSLRDVSSYLKLCSSTIGTDCLQWNKYVQQVKNVQRTGGNDDQVIEGIAHDAEAQKWIEELRADLLKQVSAQCKMLVFVIDDYGLLSGTQKKWFSLAIAQALLQAPEGWDIRFILSSTQSLFNTGEAEVYWPFTGGRAFELKIGSLSFDEAKVFLQEMSIPSSQFDAIYAKSKGVPMSLVEAVENFSAEQHREIEKAINTFFRKSTLDEKRWIFWAAHFPSFNENTLKVFGTANKALQAVEWIKQQKTFPFKHERGKIHWDPFWQQAVLVWQKTNEPERYEAYQSFVQGKREAVEAMPQAQSLEVIGLFSLMKVFTEEMLRQYFPGDYQRMNEYLKKNKHHFDFRQEKWSLKPQIRQMGAQYRKVSPIEGEKALLSRVETHEKQVEKELQKEIQKLNETIDLRKGCLDKLNQELNISADAVDREGMQRQNQAQERPAQQLLEDHKSSPWLGIGVAWLVGVIGALVLYLGLFFNQSLPVMYVVAGFFMLVVGLLGARHQRQRSRVVALASASLKATSARPQKTGPAGLEDAKRQDRMRKKSEVQADLKRLQARQDYLLEALERYK